MYNSDILDVVQISGKYWLILAKCNLVPNPIVSNNSITKIDRRNSVNTVNVKRMGSFHTKRDVIYRMAKAFCGSLLISRRIQFSKSFCVEVLFDKDIHYLRSRQPFRFTRVCRLNSARQLLKPLRGNANRKWNRDQHNQVVFHS